MKHKALFSLLVILFTVVLAVLPSFAQATGESPMLAEQVAAGTLPPLAERLPETPRVVEPQDVIDARLGNQPDSFTQGWIEGVTKLTYPEQWYILPE